MKALLIALFAVIGLTVDAQLRQSHSPIDTGKKVVCDYNSTCHNREGLGKVTVNELDPALSFCDILIYGYAGTDATTNKVKSLNAKLDLDEGQALYRQVTNLKNKYPKLKVLLGIGGNADPNNDIYMQLLENPSACAIFINSAYTLVKTYRFDGLDLAWQFKPNKAKRIRSGLGLPANKLIVGISTHGRSWQLTEDSTKTGLPPILEVENPGQAGIQTLTRGFMSYAEVCTLLPNPSNAHLRGEHKALTLIDAQVNLWLHNGLPANKLIVGIPTHGRSWQLTEDSTKTGLPPILEVENPGQAGIQTLTPGFMSYAEVCTLLPNPSNAHLRGEHKALTLTRDPTNRYGTSAYRLPDENGNFGLWIGYEDMEFAQSKATYVVRKNLAGVSIHDLCNDDFRGSCNGEKYPILRAAKYRLQQP